MGIERLDVKPSCVSEEDYAAWKAVAMEIPDFMQNLRKGYYQQNYPFCIDCSKEYAEKMRAIGRCDYPHFLPQTQGGRSSVGRRSRKVIARSVDGSETLEFDGMKAAAHYMHELGLSKSKSCANIHAAMGKPHLSANGYRWEYADSGQKKCPGGKPGHRHSEMQTQFNSTTEEL